MKTRYIPLETLKEAMQSALLRAGCPEKDASEVMDIFYRATLRGVGHHDISSLPSRLERLRDGSVKAKPEIRTVHEFGAVKVLDGDNGLGELCSVRAMEASEELAARHGIGCCVIRNSNHFLSAYPYVEASAERGCIAIIMTKCELDMHGPGGREKVIGNTPFGFAAPRGANGELHIFDFCMAYASYGEMDRLAGAGEAVPAWWGMDANGRPCTDPAIILREGVPSPIGQHKGFALATMIELLTAALGGWTVIDANVHDGDFMGHYSQTAIVIRPDLAAAGNSFSSLSQTLVDRVRALDPGVRFPGDRSRANRRRIEQAGGIELPEALLARGRPLIWM
jgi:LDH2 family malate/lactate/ureidoglycolate dehydrogenase